jgi:pilus assembly protein CpaB
MNPVRIAILGVALVAAIGLALLLRNLISPHKPVVVAAAPAKPTARVLVAARDLAVATRLTQQDMAWQPWPADSLNPSFITDGSPVTPATTGGAKAANGIVTGAKDMISGGGPQMQALTGAVVHDAIVKGEPIVKGKIVIAGEGGYMSVVLGPGMRAMSLPVSAETGAGGFVQPGDRVDVLEAHPDAGHKIAGGYVSETVASNVRVMAVDQTTGPAKNGKSTVAATVTLEVPAGATPAMAEARTRGGVMLALRSYADMGGGPGGTMAATSGHAVRLFKGGQESEVTVTR